MIYRTPQSDDVLRADLVTFDELRSQLRAQAGVAGPWLGGLRRQWLASSAESSIEIEGFRVPRDEIVAIAGGARPADPTDEDGMALSSYRRAMDHVGAMAADPAFEWVERVVLDLHFDACCFQKDKDPGQYRTRGIEVTSPGGPPFYVGPPAGDVRELVRETVQWLAEGDLDEHVVVRAAMAHLHVVSIHPFRDGNGRVSRILQSLVLALDGLLAPEFVTIEEHLGANTSAYYAALQAVQGGSYQPERDAMPFVRFCVDAHLAQARRRLEQLAEAGARWAFLERLVEQRGWPDRLVIALEQSLFQGTDRAAYIAEAEVSAPTASNDLRRLRDAGLISRRGRGPSTRYVASEGLLRDVEPLRTQSPV
jgi:Fic family protein